MAEGKNEFVEWVAKSVKWFARTKWGRFLILLFLVVIGLFLSLLNEQFDVLKYLFVDNNDKQTLFLFILLCVLVVVNIVRWFWGKPKMLEEIHVRFSMLVFCVCLGLTLGVETARGGFLPPLFLDSYGRLQSNLISLIIGLPVFVALWVFRTRDIREQIEKTQEQINFGFFSDAKKSFFSKENLKERTASFVQLVKLQQQKLFREEIKIIFRGGELNRPENEEGAYLKGVDLRGVDLSDTGFELKGASLEGVKLQGAKLRGVKLGGAHLEEATLEGATLEGATLEGATLRGANLRGANLERTDLRGVEFNRETNLTNANLNDARVLGSGRDNNALNTAGLLLSSTQWNQLIYLPLDLQGVNLQEKNLQEIDWEKENLKEANLRGVNLQRANLRGATLEGATLRGANLRGANLEGTNLEGTNLEGTNLEGVYLQRVNLEGANLQGTNLQGANLQRANLRNAQFDNQTKLTTTSLNDARVSGSSRDDNTLRTAGVNLSDAEWDWLVYLPSDLQGVNLQGKNLREIDWENENLGGAHLGGANLRGAHLGGANLGGAHLEGTHLEGANLEGANLQGANLRGAHLREANLGGAKLIGANLQGTNLGGAKFDNRTNLANANLMSTLVSGSGLYNNALRTAGVSLSETQSNELRYLP